MLLVKGKPACDPKPVELVTEMPTLCWLLPMFCLNCLSASIYLFHRYHHPILFHEG